MSHSYDLSLGSSLSKNMQMAPHSHTISESLTAYTLCKQNVYPLSTPEYIVSSHAPPVIPSQWTPFSNKFCRDATCTRTFESDAAKDQLGWKLVSTLGSDIWFRFVTYACCRNRCLVFLGRSCWRVWECDTWGNAAFYKGSLQCKRSRRELGIRFKSQHTD